MKDCPRKDLGAILIELIDTDFDQPVIGDVDVNLHQTHALPTRYRTHNGCMMYL